MANTIDAQKRMITLGDGTELQEWKVYRDSTDAVEYQMYIGHNHSKPGQTIYSKGAIWMLFRISNPDIEDADQTTEYRMGHTGVPGGTDTAQTEWDNKTTATYYRFDEVMRTFFNG